MSSFIGCLLALFVYHWLTEEGPEPEKFAEESEE